VRLSSAAFRSLALTVPGNHPFRFASSASPYVVYYND
jgi:hypothetical protein